MGNYQEYLKKMNPLRELDETGGLRTQLFGNPYKLERPADKVGVAIEWAIQLYMSTARPPVEASHSSSVLLWW